MKITTCRPAGLAAGKNEQHKTQALTWTIIENKYPLHFIFVLKFVAQSLRTKFEETSNMQMPLISVIIAMRGSPSNHSIDDLGLSKNWPPVGL